MNDCQECARLRAENEKLKRRITMLEAVAKRPEPKIVTQQDMTPAMQQADIARRTLPPPKPRGPQC